MAEKKNTGRSGKKKTPKRQNVQSSRQKTVETRKNTTSKTVSKASVSTNVLTGIIGFILFVLFVVISFNADGVLLNFIRNLAVGLFGRAGFYFAIPAFLCLFIIQIFGRKEDAAMRSWCLFGFVLSCGSFYHLMVQHQELSKGLAAIQDLYQKAAYGWTGGVICGGFAELLRLVCGLTITYIILGIILVLCLLGSLQITIPRIAKAIAERPRGDWDDEDQEEFVEPATVVVNHIANKQIQAKQRKRQQAVQTPIQEIAHDKAAAVLPPAKKKQPPKPSNLTAQATESEKIPAGSGTPSKASDVFKTIGQEIDTPLVGSPSQKTQPSRKQTISVQPVKPVVIAPDEIPFGDDEKTISETINETATVKVTSAAPVTAASAASKSVISDVTRQEVAASQQKISHKDTVEAQLEVTEEINKSMLQNETVQYAYPPIDLLSRPVGAAGDGTDEIRENSRRLSETLASFKIDAHITDVTRGPSVTRYEVELDRGVRLNKLTGCADDIALSLGASGVRIAAVPGKISIVGIEVPNKLVTTVSLREVISSPNFSNAKSRTSFSVGKDIGGNCIVGNIAKMPHMLIAGTTGSGKSVCMNSLIISLLYKAKPSEVKLIMVDPKMVELGIYNGIPHLMIPVVTDPKKAAGALQWSVTEMLRRYKLMSEAGVRDLESYNSLMEAEQKLPQVVIIIDELADLMLVAAKEVEDSICRVAQMGRASGMHLVIATQRPSADVITGLMKANIPSRIAFSVASGMESRIILDTQGAEKLVGKGDMLYAPIGCGKPLRVQGCFVTDSEVEKVASFVKDNSQSDYNQQVLDEIEKNAANAGKAAKQVGSDIQPTDEELDGDEMLPAAVDVILETGQASVSMLQRRLKLGYARAARIVDEMEEKGYVGPFQGSKPRSILITKEQWEARKNGDTAACEPVPEDNI